MTDYSGLSKDALDILKKTGVVIEGSNISIDFLCDSYLLAQEGKTIGEIRLLSDEEKLKVAEKMVDFFKDKAVIGEMKGGAKKAEKNAKWFGKFFADAIDKLKGSGIKFPEKKQLESLKGIDSLNDTDFMYAAEYAKRFQIYTETLTDRSGKNIPSEKNPYGIDTGFEFKKGFGGKIENTKVSMVAGNNQILARNMSMLTTLSSIALASNKLHDKELSAEKKAYLKSVLELKLVKDMYGKDISLASADEHVLKGIENRAWIGTVNHAERFEVGEEQLGFDSLKLDEKELNEILEGPSGDKVKNHFESKETLESNLKRMDNFHKTEIAQLIKMIATRSSFNLYEITDDDGRKVFKEGEEFTVENLRRYMGKSSLVNKLVEKFDEIFDPILDSEQPYRWKKQERTRHEYGTVGDSFYVVMKVFDRPEKYRPVHIIREKGFDHEKKGTNAKIVNSIESVSKAMIMCIASKEVVGYSRMQMHYDNIIDYYPIGKHSVVDRFRTKEEAKSAAEDDIKKKNKADKDREKAILKLEKKQLEADKDSMSALESVDQRIIITKEEEKVEQKAKEDVKVTAKGKQEEKIEVKAEIVSEAKASAEPDTNNLFFTEKPILDKLQFADFMVGNEKDIMRQLNDAGFIEADSSDIRAFLYIYAMGEKGYTIEGLHAASPEEKKRIGEDFLKDVTTKGRILEGAKDMDVNAARNSVEWYAKMLSKTMDIIKKQPATMPKDMLDNTDKAQRIRYTNIWMSMVVTDSLVRGSFAKLFSLTKERKTKENPLGFNQRKVFADAYGPSFTNDRKMSNDISIVGDIFYVMQNEKYSKENRVKAKLLGEFFVADGKFFANGNIKNPSGTQVLLSRVMENAKVGFSGLFTDKETDKLLSASLKELEKTDNKLYTKAKTAIEKAIERAVIISDNLAEVPVENLEFKRSFIKDTSSIIIKEDMLGKDLLKKADKGENEAAVKANLSISMEEVRAAYSLKAKEAKAKGMDPLADYLSAMEFLCDTDIDLKGICDRTPGMKEMLDFIKSGLFMSSKNGETLFEIYEKINEDEDTRKEAEAYIQIVCGIKELIKADSIKRKDKRISETVRAVKELKEARVKMRAAFDKYGEKALDRFTEKPLEEALKNDSFEILDSSVAFYNELQENGWSENESEVAVAINHLRLCVKSNYNNNTQLIKEGNREAEEKKEYYKKCVSSMPFSIKDKVSVKTSSDKLRLIKWAECFISKYGKDPVLKEASDSIRQFMEHKDAVLESVQKDVKKEIDSADSTEKKNDIILKLFDSDKYSSKADNSLAEKQLDKLSKDKLIELFESVLSQKVDKIREGDFYENVYRLSDSLEDSSKLGGGAQGLGRIQSEKDKIIYTALKDKATDPLSQSNNNSVFAIRQLKLYLKKRGIEQKQINRIERRIAGTSFGTEYHLYKLMFSFWDKKKEETDVIPKLDANERLADLEFKKDIKDIRLKAVERLEPQIYAFIQKGYEAAKEAHELINELKGDGFAEARDALSAVTQFINKDSNLKTRYEALDGIDKCITDLSKKGGVDKKIIAKLDSFYEKWTEALDDSAFPEIVYNADTDQLLKICSETYKVFGAERSDEGLKKVQRAQDKAKSAEKSYTDMLDAEAEKEAALERERKAVEAERKAVEKREQNIAGYKKDLINLEKSSEGITDPELLKTNAEERKKVLNKLYIEERSVVVKPIDKEKKLDGGNLTYDGFVKIFADKGVDTTEKKRDMNLLNAIFNLLPEETSRESIEEMAGLAPFNVKGISKLSDKVKILIGGVRKNKAKESSFDYINATFDRAEEVNEVGAEIQSLKKRTAKAVEEDNIIDDGALPAAESKRITDKLKNDIGKCKNYTAVFTAVNAQKDVQMGRKERILHAAYAMAAVQLAEEGKKFSSKTLKERAESIVGNYLSTPDILEKYSDKKLTSGIANRDAAFELNGKIVNDLYGIESNAEMKRYLKDMDTLSFNMMNQIHPEVRSEQYQRLVRAVKYAASIKLGKSSKANTEAIADANFELVAAAFNYMDDKKSVRSSDEGKWRFDNALDALAIVRTYAQGTAVMIDKYVDSINAKRKSKAKTAKWHVDITKFGAKNAEAKEIAREKDKKLGKKAMFAEMKRLRLQRDVAIINNNELDHVAFNKLPEEENLINTNINTASRKSRINKEEQD